MSDHGKRFATCISVEENKRGRLSSDTSPEAVEAAVRGLDGDTYTLVILTGDGGPTHSLNVGGGKDGRYAANITHDSARVQILIRPGGTEEADWLPIGGQDSPVRDKDCVSLDFVLRAALYYAEHGEADPSLPWEEKQC